MKRQVLDIGDYIVLVEEASPDVAMRDACAFEEPLIGVAFYGEGDVTLCVEFNGEQKQYQHTKGLTLSFYADEQVEFVHHIDAKKSMQSIVIATALRNLSGLPNEEGDLFAEFLRELVEPKASYVEGPRFFMTPEMQQIVQAIFQNKYEGKTRMMFFRSQITLLLAHFFGQLSTLDSAPERQAQREKLLEAKTILDSHLENPPTLSELSRQIGLNTSALKKEFKALFGVPVFKYLQHERLSTAHHLIQSKSASVQEAAWQVGYDSLSSFSNAFTQKFGYRPSQIK